MIQLFDDSHLKSLRSVVTKRPKFFISSDSITLRSDTRVPPTTESNCGCYCPFIRERKTVSRGNSTTVLLVFDNYCCLILQVWADATELLHGPISQSLGTHYKRNRWDNGHFFPTDQHISHPPSLSAVLVHNMSHGLQVILFSFYASKTRSGAYFGSE